jgi:tetratricopeptide (TPR) repeat protein
MSQMSREPSVEQQAGEAGDNEEEQRSIILFWIAIIGLVIAALTWLQSQGVLQPIGATPTPTATWRPTATPLPIATPRPTPTLAPSPTPLAFRAAAEDEILIMVLTFAHEEGVAPVDFRDEIRRQLQSDVDRSSLSHVRVEVEPAVIHAAESSTQRQKAEQLARRYNASLVIWGQYHAARVDVNFLNMQKPYSALGAVAFTETEHTQLANPGAYSQFVIKHLPNQVSFLSLYAIGRIQGREKLDLATDLIQQALNHLPRNPSESLANARATAHFHLGWLYQIDRNLVKAIYHYNQAIRIQAPDFDYAPIFNNRGLARHDLNRYEPAIVDFSKAIELRAEYDDAYCNRGLSHYRLAKYEEALTDYKKAISINGENARAYFYLGFTHARLGQTAEALDNYGKALLLNNEAPRVFYYRGLAYYNRGRQEADFENAVNDFTSAIELNPAYRDAYYHRASAHERLGNVQQAVADYEHCVELYPAGSTIHEVCKERLKALTPNT